MGRGKGSCETSYNAQNSSQHSVKRDLTQLRLTEHREEQHYSRGVGSLVKPFRLGYDQSRPHPVGLIPGC